MIIGYSVICVNKYNKNEDILLKNKEIYSWEKALKMSYLKAQEIKINDETRIMSLVMSNSEEMCKINNEVIIFKLIHKDFNDYTNINIIAVHDE